MNYLQRDKIFFGFHCRLYIYKTVQKCKIKENVLQTWNVLLEEQHLSTAFEYFQIFGSVQNNTDVS
jgi:hypothetical protein